MNAPETLFNTLFRKQIIFRFTPEGVGRLENLIYLIKRGQLLAIEPTLAELEKLYNDFPVYFVWRRKRHRQKIVDTKIKVQTTRHFDAENFVNNFFTHWAIAEFEISLTDIAEKSYTIWTKLDKIVPPAMVVKPLTQKHVEEKTNVD